MAIASGTPPPLTDVPAPLAEVVMRALEKTPEARFPQPEAMAEALGRYLARAGEPASSHTLAAFLAAQNLPLTLLEQAQSAKDAAPASAAAAAPPAPMAPPPPSPQTSGAGARPQEPSAEWALPPGSSELSMSGRLVSAPPPQRMEDTLLKAPSQPSLKAVSTPVAQATVPMPSSPPTTFRCMRCEAPLPSAYAPCDRCATELTMSGNAPLLASPSVLETPAENLELQSRGPREETFWEHKPRRPWGRWALRLAVVGALGAGVFFALPYLQPLLPRAERVVRGAFSETPLKPPPLVINSEPTGARVVVSGQDKGTTPLLMDNDYPPGEEIPLELTLRGYKPWKGTFPGNAPAQFDVRLQKQR
jgi:serine/threonine-protein kinase